MTVASLWVPTWEAPIAVVGGIVCEATWDFLVAEYGEPDAISPNLRPLIGALAEVLVADLLRNPRSR